MKFLFTLFLMAVPLLAQAPFNATNIKLTNPTVQGTAASVSRMFTLNTTTGVGETVTPTVAWSAIVLTGTVDTTDISGFSALGRALVDDTTTSIMQDTLGATTVGKAFFTTANPSAITFPRVNANNTVSWQTAADFRTDIGGTTVGQSYFTLTNPSAITFPRQNANNTVTSRTATEFKTDLSLENVTNTSDTNKPVSTAQQTALDLKANAANPVFSGTTATSAAAPTIASATTIAPVTAILFVSGTTTIETITPPAPISTRGGQITIIPTGVFATGVTGNIALASTSVVSRALTMTYDSGTGKFYPSY